MMFAMAFLVTFGKTLTLLLHAAFSTFGALSAVVAFIALCILWVASIASSAT